MDWSKYKSAPLIKNVNYKLIPVTLLPISEEGAQEFNEIYRFLITQNYKKIRRTPSGGISTDRQVFRPPMWDISTSTSFLELTVLIKEGMFRFQFRYNYLEHPEAMTGMKAIKLFTARLEHDTGINLADYCISNGMDVRKNVPKYRIALNERMVNATPDITRAQIFKNCHHIDFHSSFPAGLANTHPEFRPTIEFFYEHRKKVPAYKGLLNSLIGVMWSPKFRGACLAHLALDAIADNNKRLEDITQRLKASGRIPLLWNTDGVWYTGKVYHGEGESNKLGAWENDYTECTLRIKSPGAYEFIDGEGNYHPVLRGRTTLDKQKERGLWEWGDIFDREAVITKFYFVEGEGVVYERGSEFE